MEKRLRRGGGRLFGILGAFEEEGDLHAEQRGELEQAARTDPIGALLFLNLLEGYSGGFRQLGLRELARSPRQTKPETNVPIDRMNAVLCHQMLLISPAQP